MTAELSHSSGCNERVSEASVDFVLSFVGGVVLYLVFAGMSESGNLCKAVDCGGRCLVCYHRATWPLEVLSDQHQQTSLARMNKWHCGNGLILH